MSIAERKDRVFKGNFKKWVVVSVSVLTILLTVILGVIASSYTRTYIDEGVSSIIFESYQDLMIIIGVAVISGIITIFKESIISTKVFCACIVLLATLYLYSYVHYILRLIPNAGIIFVIVGWFPILLGILAYKILVRLISNKKNSDSHL